MTKQEITQRIIELKMGNQTLKAKKEIQSLQQQFDEDVVTEE